MWLSVFGNALAQVTSQCVDPFEERESEVTRTPSPDGIYTAAVPSYGFSDNPTGSMTSRNGNLLKSVSRVQIRATPCSRNKMAVCAS
jgi:hypothetical protein